MGEAVDDPRGYRIAGGEKDDRNRGRRLSNGANVIGSDGDDHVGFHVD
jgi:hypothetical protein